MTVKEQVVDLDLNAEEAEKLKFICVGRMDWMLQDGEAFAAAEQGSVAIGPKRYFGAGWEDGEDGSPLSVRLSAKPPTMDGAFEMWDEESCFFVPIELLVKIFDPVTEGAQYAITALMDQTIGYLSFRKGYYFSISHGKEVWLENDLENALELMDRENADGVYAVYDEEEFRARPDTW